MKWLEVFAGCGGVRCGLDAAGHETLASIELMPAIAACYSANHQDDKMIVADVRDVNIASLPSGINAIWASPVCKSDSKARSKLLDRREDASIGMAMLPYIEKIQPDLFILENVEMYRSNPAYHSIILCLLKHRYTVSERVINAQDYGVPQYRRRLILQARRGPIAWPDYAPRQVGWYEALQDLFDTMEPSGLANWQQQLWKPEYERMKPLMVAGHYDFRDHASDPHELCIIPSSKPSPCVTSSHNNTHRRIVLEDGRILRISPRENARLQSFPDEYKFPESVVLAQEVIGNAVPPLMVEALTRPYATRAEREAA